MTHDRGEIPIKQIRGPINTTFTCGDFSGLTQVSTQIRTEFRPLFMHQLQVSLRFLDLKVFMDTFLRTALEDPTSAPGAIEILLDDEYGTTYDVEKLDITPLIRIILLMSTPSIDITSYSEMNVGLEDTYHGVILSLSRIQLNKHAWQRAFEDDIEAMILRPFERQSIKMVMKSSCQLKWLIREPSGEQEKRRSETASWSLFIVFGY